MAGLDNLSRGELGDIFRRLRQLETASPLQNASIGANGLRVYGGGVITIENGGLKVTGTAEIIGTLIASGIIDFTGDVTISGPFTVSGATDITGPLTIAGTTDITGDTTVTGDLDVNGPMTTTGTLDVEGVTTLKNDLNVTGSGKIVAGDTIIRPSGAINLGPTLTIAPPGEFGPGGISDGFATYYLTPGGGDYFHQFQGGAFVEGMIRGHGGLRIVDLPTTPSPPNLHIDPATGVIKRSTA